MASVLVTGGTGTLGRAVVPLLLDAGHRVRVMSRRSRPAVPERATAVQADVRTGTGVERAVADCDVVVHAATSPRRRVKQTEVDGTRHVAAAARAVGAHLVYVSIVGVDVHRFFYYRAKYAAEHVVAGSGAAWSVLRATQFHDFLDGLLGGPVFFRTPHLRFQPVHVQDVARRLVEVVAGEPQGLLRPFGGPEVLTVDELVAARREVLGAAPRLVPVPAVGFAGDFDAGRQLAPDDRCGTTTWREWLAARAPITG